MYLFFFVFILGSGVASLLVMLSVLYGLIRCLRCYVFASGMVDFAIAIILRQHVNWYDVRMRQLGKRRDVGNSVSLLECLLKGTYDFCIIAGMFSNSLFFLVSIL